MAMEKKQSTPRHYVVKVLIKPQGFNKVYLEGIFIPKGDECSASKIKEQCWDFIKTRIKYSQLGIDPEQVEKEIKVKALPCDFLVCEDK